MIILVIVTIVIYCILLRIIPRKSGEDLYQYNKNNTQRTGSFVYSYVRYHTPFDPQILRDLTEYYNNYAESYLPHEVVPKALVIPTPDNIPFLTSLRTLKSQDSIFVVCHGTHTILVALDHVYLGASFFHEVGRIMAQGTCAYGSEDPPGFPLLDLCVARFLGHWLLRDSGDYVPVAKSDKFLRRHFYSFATIGNPAIGDATIYSMYTVLGNILQRTNRYELRSYITYGFRHTKEIRNNIGIIFCTFTKDMTLAEFNDYILGNKYQIVATNYFMQILDKGKEVRNSVDLVMSLGSITTNHNNILDISCTFGSIPDYPIYCCLVSINDITHVSITLNTDEYVMD